MQKSTRDRLEEVLARLSARGTVGSGTALTSILLRNPQVANHFDLTSISLPMPGMALPAGLMLFARHGVDRRLLNIAAAVERVLGR